MATKLEYKLVVGSKENFEEEMNRLSSEGWIDTGSISMTVSERGILFGQLMTKTVNQNECDHVWYGNQVWSRCKKCGVEGD